MTEERFLVTGGTGCIGSWVVRNLIKQSVPVIVLTMDDYFQRLRLIMTNEEFECVKFAYSDITDIDALVDLAKKNHINRIIHLAGLQLPFCKANPIQGASVNVGGTINMFEIAKRVGIDRLVYASSAAVYGPKNHYHEVMLGDSAPFFPTSHYGVFKSANEQNAQVYWWDDSISSIGLRPHIVYGPGRDQGMTSKLTVSMIAVAAKQAYHINFGGRYQFQYVEDVANVFVAAARASFKGASTYNIGGRVSQVKEFVQAIEELDPEAASLITYDDKPLSLPEGFENNSMCEKLGKYNETSIKAGVEQTLRCYTDAIHRGLIDNAYVKKILAQ